MRRWILALVATCLLAAPGTARALSIGLDSLSFDDMGMEFITFTVSFTPSTAVSGYDLSVAWDSAELEFDDFSDMFGGFGADPTGANPAGERASRLIFGTFPTVGPLFTMTFKVLDRLNDGGPDFRVFVGSNNGPGVGSPPGQSLSIDNLAGLSYDVTHAVPEPWMGLLLGSAFVPFVRRRA